MKISNTKVKCMICCILFFHMGVTDAQQVTDYNVVWNSPSHHSGGSMPLGNGETGMNVWVEENGDLLFYLSRKDAFSEANRLMKLGRVRVALSPNPFEKGTPFTQTLLLNDGVIEIQAGKTGQETVLRLFMDTPLDVVHMTCESKLPRKITVTAESWRREPYTFKSFHESQSAYTMLGFPMDKIPVESADIFLSGGNAVSWYHHNRGTQLYDFTMRHQDKTACAKNFPDPVSERIFGVYMTGKGFSKTSDSTFSTKGAVTQASLKMTCHSEQVSSVEKWIGQVKAMDKKSTQASALNNSKKWWNGFWNRSYIYIHIPDNPDFGYKLTQSYILQRYMAAGSGRGKIPIRFNGSIFTTDPQYANENYTYGPDYRDWGNDFWWQNTRLPYFAMPASGDFDLMFSLFDFYLNRMDAFKIMAGKYYDAKGVVIPEIVTVFGTHSNGIYGVDGWQPDGAGMNKMVRYIWVQGLELSKLMLDYYWYTGDDAFLKEKALPAIKEILLYFDSRFVKGQEKMKISPTQAVESVQGYVINDMPCVAGLHYLMNTLETLPDGCLTDEDKTFYTQLKKTLPPLPRQESAEGDIFIPAEEYLSRRDNVENPELYAVFPFELANFSNEWKETGIRTYHRRVYRQNTGWGQDGQIVAILGMTDSLPAMLKEKIENTNVNHRFPAMWSPNYDWLPDQCHGSNLLLTVQYMLLQTYNGKTHVLPAFPGNWEVSFKLWTPNRKAVEGKYRNGKLDYTR